MNVGVNNCDTSQQLLVINFIRHCGKFLMPRQRRRIIVHVTFEKNLLENEGIMGDCDIDYSADPPDWFDIRVDNALSKEELLLTLAHEIVHVKQYARRELKQLIRSPYYRFHKEYFHMSTPYNERPWETEAHDLESELVETWHDEE